MIKITDDINSLKRNLNTKNFNEISSVVRNIINDVILRGDNALKDYTLKFDGVMLENFEVPRDLIDASTTAVGADYSALLERCADNIRLFHKKQLHEGFFFSPSKGVILGQRLIPIEHVGIYVPGGSASYPSTVLMNAIPAEIAGCNEIIIVTPPPVNNKILAAAKISGVHRVFSVGGAQAVAALAYGTESIPKVDKITGPGNSYVAEAKRQVFGKVGIDMIAGPSEILIIADENNNPKHLAADLLAQAEHDKNAAPILITTSRLLAQNVSNEIELQLKLLERHETANASIDNNGLILIVNNLDDAVKTADQIAPEHLELCVDKPFELMTAVKNAGSIFIGKNSPEALGDYYAGVNHTLPTMGTARFSSGLSVDDFVKKSQFLYYSPEALEKASDDIETFAKSEGLTAHADSIAVRRKTH